MFVGWSTFMVWYGTVWYGMVWYGMVWYGMVWYGMVWFGMVWFGMVWYGMVWYGTVWYGLVWSGMVPYGIVGWYRKRPLQLPKPLVISLVGWLKFLCKVSEEEPTRMMVLWYSIEHQCKNCGSVAGRCRKRMFPKSGGVLIIRGRPYFLETPKS